MCESLQILVLGNATTAEMQPIVETLRQNRPDQPIKIVGHIGAAIELITSEGWYPDLVVILQSWPDEYSPADVQNLVSLLPLARLICCFGAWCESDGRNRTTWPLAVRVPARCASARLRRELDVLRGRGSALPLTAARDEIFAFDHLDQITATGSGQPIAIYSMDSGLRNWLQDLLTAAGYRVTEDANTSAAVIWDVDPWNATAARSLRQFHDARPTTPIIALAGFARPEDTHTLIECGVQTPLAKVVTAAELLHALAGQLNSE